MTSTRGARTLATVTVWTTTAVRTATSRSAPSLNFLKNKNQLVTVVINTLAPEVMKQVAADYPAMENIQNALAKVGIIGFAIVVLMKIHL